MEYARCDTARKVEIERVVAAVTTAGFFTDQDRIAALYSEDARAVSNTPDPAAEINPNIQTPPEAFKSVGRTVMTHNSVMEVRRNVL